MTNIQSTSIYNILYIMLLSKMKFKFLKIDGVKDNSKENYDEKIINKNQLKENRNVRTLSYYDKEEIIKNTKEAFEDERKKLRAQRDEQEKLHEENLKNIGNMIGI